MPTNSMVQCGSEWLATRPKWPCRQFARWRRTASRFDSPQSVRLISEPVSPHFVQANDILLAQQLSSRQIAFTIAADATVNVEAWSGHVSRFEVAPNSGRPDTYPIQHRSATIESHQCDDAGGGAPANSTTNDVGCGSAVGSVFLRERAICVQQRVWPWDRHTSLH